MVAAMCTERAASNVLTEKLEAHQQEKREAFVAVRRQFALLRSELADHRTEMRADFRRIHEQLAEIKGLIINSRGGHAQ